MSDEVEKDMSALFAVPATYITNLNGEQIAMPKKTARIELLISGILSRYAESGQKDWPEIDLANLDEKSIAVILPKIGMIAPDLISDLVGAIFNRPPNEVLDEFDLDQIMEAIIPFLASQVSVITMLSDKVGRLVRMIGTTDTAEKDESQNSPQ